MITPPFEARARAFAAGHFKTAAAAGLIARLALGGFLVYGALLRFYIPFSETLDYLASFEIIHPRSLLPGAYLLSYAQLFLGVYILTGLAVRACAGIAALHALITAAAFWNAAVAGIEVYRCACAPLPATAFFWVPGVLIQLVLAACVFYFGGLIVTIDSWARK